MIAIAVLSAPDKGVTEVIRKNNSSFGNLNNGAKAADHLFFDNGRDFVFKRLDTMNQLPAPAAPIVAP